MAPFGPSGVGRLVSEVEAQKRAAAEAAVCEVMAGMLVGLGTGTTAAHAIAALAARHRAGLTIACVATSDATAAAASAAGLPVRDMAGVAQVDLVIDGVDEIDPGFRAIKGGGGAMLREKVVAQAATRMIAIADVSKAVPRLGARALPLELLPFATASVAAQVTRLGATPTLRHAPDGSPFRTDSGNHVLDCAFPELPDLAVLAARLSAIAGVLGHGLFLDEIDALYLAGTDGVVARERPR